MGTVEHIIVTRYNVPLKFPTLSPEFSPLDEHWLEHRYSLFQQFCVPSVEQQTDQEFTWLIAFHPDTPARYYNYLQERWSVCFALSTAQLMDAVRQQVGSHLGPVVSTRLDNDDSLARRFVDTTKSISRKLFENSDIFGLPHAIYYRFGLERDVATRQIYSRDYLRGPFVSLIEDAVPNGSIRTVLAHGHYDMERSFHATMIGNKLPMWTINVHDKNVANTIRGDLIEDESDRRIFLNEFGY